MTAPQTSAMRLEEFREDCATLDTEAFGELHGEAFLIHHGSSENLQSPERMRQTQLVETIPASSGATPQGNFLVFSVRQTGRSAFPNFISIGRTSNNDIVIEDESLSKFHAYIRKDPERGFLIQDAGSSNGTRVDDEPVPTKEDGEPTLLESGARVAVGRVELTFLPCEAFRTLIKMSLD